MQKSLDIIAKRMEITSQNISNVNTPHYKAKKLEFENLLLQKIEETKDSHALRLRLKKSGETQTLEKYLNSVSPKIYTDDSTEMKIDGNNVDIDHENLELAKIQLQYNYMVRKITDEFSLLRTAINEGR